jgi:hypothetical protein
MYWLSQSAADKYVVLSTDTADDIAEASTWWQATAIAAATVLCVVCAFGWWHQRRLRWQFDCIVKKIEPTLFSRW